MARMWFLLASLGLLLSTAVYSENPSNEDQYNSIVRSVLIILWKSLTTEIRNKSNVLIFAVPTVTDSYYIYDSMDENTKKEVLKSIPAFGINKTKTVDAVDVEFSTELSGEMKFQTILYGDFYEVYKRMIFGFRPMLDKVSPLNERFTSFFRIMDTVVDENYATKELRSRVGLRGENERCSVRHCPIQQIVSSKPPFAIFTLATWKITSLAEFNWINNADFAISETLRLQVPFVQGYSNFDCAIFKYSNPSGCAGRVIRFTYMQNFFLFFVIPYFEQTRCTSSEDLWKNVQDVYLDGLYYRRQGMLVSIPIFNASANIDLRMKLKGSSLTDAFVQPSSKVYNSSAYQTAEVIFNPLFQKNKKPLSIPLDKDSIFSAHRPFFFSLSHKISKIPIFAGLINNPGCNSEC